MAILYPSRRILGSPAWLWLGLAVLPFLAANLLMDSDFSRRSKLAEPADCEMLTREQMIVGREGDAFRFVPVAEVKAATRGPLAEWKDLGPLWVVSVYLVHHEETSTCGESEFLGGLIRQKARWIYALSTRRTDYGFRLKQRKKGFDWKGDKENPYELRPEQIRKVIPVLVAELNRRVPKGKLGDRLGTMVDDGVEGSSTSYTPQNALVLLRWLAILMTVVGLGSMFIRPRMVSIKPGVLPMSQNEVLLSKIATVRARLNKRYKDAC